MQVFRQRTFSRALRLPLLRVRPRSNATQRKRKSLSQSSLTVQAIWTWRLDCRFSIICWIRLRHGLIDLTIRATGDLDIDAHHTVEDIGITLGQALNRALDKTGIRRYGHAYVPLDEALSRVVLDFSGRPGLDYHVEFVKGTVGNFDVDLFHEFFQGFVNHAMVTLHIDNIRGKNAHHQIETIFKAFGRALRTAMEIDARAADHIPSTKGVL